jgi:creatinine amidohydrolase
MQLSFLTWAEAEAAFQKSPMVIVPIGSTEQHGPNGLIGTDALNAEAVSVAVGRATATVVTPVISIGMAQHHLAFAGSITLRPSTMIAFVSDYVFSLARHGVKKFFFINGHGGNVAPLSAAFSEIYAAASLDPSGTVPRLRCVCHNWYDQPAVKAYDGPAFGDKNGTHATAGEVSVTQHLFPDAIKRVNMPPVTPTRRRFTDAKDLRALHPDGRIGAEPSLATPAHGKALFDAAVTDLAAAVHAFAADPM